MMQHLEQGGFTGGTAHTSTRTGGSPSKKGQPALPVYKPYEESRFQESEGMGASSSSPAQKSELTRGDVREARDITLRQVMNIDDRVDKNALSRRPIAPAPEEPEVRGKEIAIRGGASYRPDKREQ